MGSNPINLLFRFLLEVAALIAFAFWGWTQFETPWHWLFAIGTPIIAATIWGTFAVPDDPSRSGNAPVPTPGAIRLILELLFFALAAVALGLSEQSGPAILLAVLVIIHYALSIDRIRWLLSRREE